jgi:hypothetical protein
MYGYDNVNATILKKQLSAAKTRAKGVLVWNYALAEHYRKDPKKGIFAEGASQSASYPLFITWPMYEGGVEGWYKRYVSKEKHSGTITATIYDTSTGGTDGVEPSYFVKEIYVNETGTVLYSDGVPGNEGAEKESLDLGTTPVTLVVQVRETDAVGNVPTGVYYNITLANGTVLNASDFTFESGHSWDAYTDVYDTVATAYTSW